jgi:hypothetical protein
MFMVTFELHWTVTFAVVPRGSVPVYMIVAADDEAVPDVLTDEPFTSTV